MVEWIRPQREKNWANSERKTARPTDRHWSWFWPLDTTV